MNIYKLPPKVCSTNDLVQLGCPEDKKSGEELLAELLGNGTLAKKRREFDAMDIDYDFEDRSDHSSRSDQSDLLNFLGDDTDVTVKNMDQSQGIKLIFSKKPKTKPTPDSECGNATPSTYGPVLPELVPEVSAKHDVEIKSPEIILRYTTTKTVIQTVHEEEPVDDKKIFEHSGPVQHRTVVFEFVYAGIKNACEYIEKPRISIDIERQTEKSMNTLHDMSKHLPIKGKPFTVGKKVTINEHTRKKRWAIQLRSCSIENII